MKSLGPEARLAQPEKPVTSHVMESLLMESLGMESDSMAKDSIGLGLYIYEGSI